MKLIFKQLQAAGSGQNGQRWNFNRNYSWGGSSFPLYRTGGGKM